MTRQVRLERLRAWTRETLRGGPTRVLRITYRVVVVTCWIDLILLVAIHGPGHSPTRVTVAETVVGALLVLASGAFFADLWLRRRSRPVAAIGKRELPTAIAAAFTVWFPLLVVPMYLLAKSTQPSHEIWIEYGFLDKRWIVALFLLGTIGASLCLSLGGALVRWGDGGSAAAVASDPSETPTSQSYLFIAAKLLAAVGLAAFFYGPPWTIAPVGGSIGYHEDVHLGGFQAIAGGATPYVDQASVQYGPGAQLLSYLFMHHVGGVSIVGFRESFALMHWLGATVFFAALFLRLRFLLALVASVVAALFFPTLQLYGFASDRTYIGYFGWGNILRFLGAFVIVLFFPVAIQRVGRNRLRIGACALLGFAWGIGCVFAQESLIAGLAGLLALTVLLVLSQTVTFVRAREGLAAVAAGFLALWIPILGFYAADGTLTDFVRTYFFFPRAVASGYSNTAFLEGWHSPWGPLYFLLPYIFAALGIVCLVRLRPLRLATRWSDRRVTFVSLFIICAVSFEGCLLRADSSHLANGILALPALFVVGVAELPRLVGLERQAARWSASLVLALGVFVLIGHYERTPAAIQAAVMSPVHAHLHPPPVDKLQPTASIAERRIGDGLFRGPICCTDSTVSMSTLARFMDHLHALLGRRPTYVAGFPDGYPGLVYFLADLTPAPIYLERQMVISQSVEVPFFAYFEKHLPDVYAIVSTEPASSEMVAFRRAYPRARRVTLRYPRAPLYVLMRDGGNHAR